MINQQKNKTMLSISLSKVTTKNLDYLGEQTIALSAINSNSDIVANVLFQQLKTTHAQYNQVVIKKTYSGLGEDLKNLDLTRDRFYSSIVRIVDAFAVFDGTAKQAPAQLLQKVISETGAINGLSYAAESIVLNKLTERFSVPDVQSAISTLGIGEEVTKLADTQKQFDTLYTEQLDANSDLRQQSSASAMRKELESVLRSYYALVSAMSAVEPWKDIYSDLTELLKKF